MFLLYGLLFASAVALAFIVTATQMENFISTGALIQLETSRPMQYVVAIPDEATA